MILLRSITLYPIKSLDGVQVDSAVFLPQGSLAQDRRFALVDEQGQFVNAKRHAGIHQIRARFRLQKNQVELGVQGLGGDDVFDLDRDRQALGQWCSDYFGFQVRLRENNLGGFPDDNNYSGPTLISDETLTTVAGWFAGISVDSMRRRLRANLEISADAPFWEDRLLDWQGRAVPFQIGGASLLGGNPCQRCPVPARDPDTGKVTVGFQEEFARLRESQLPAWANAGRFDHFYRVSVNTRLHQASAGVTIRAGDRLVLGQLQDGRGPGSDPVPP